MTCLKTCFIFRVLHSTYVAYAILTFAVTFLLLMPLFIVADVLKKPKWGLRVNHYWSRLYFALIAMPIEYIKKGRLDKRANYIFCANHFSFLDIAVLPFIPISFKFVGKVSITKAPLLGYVFRAFHITVDRSKLKARYQAYTESIKALKEGFSLVVFPEGGIVSKQPPKMGRFKEGAFRMAIETSTPLVPVSLIDNWRIFPAKGKFIFRRRKCRIVVHEPIPSDHYSYKTLKSFQAHVYQIIQQEMYQFKVED